jgi:hypothetical protein
VKNASLSLRDQAEIERSSVEARNTVLKPVNPEQVERYLAPLSTTPFELEYAFHLLGDVNGKVVLDLGCGFGRQPHSPDQAWSAHDWHRHLA